jgi:hypothetical protein
VIDILIVVHPFSSIEIGEDFFVNYLDLLVGELRSSTADFIFVLDQSVLDKMYPEHFEIYENEMDLLAKTLPITRYFETNYLDKSLWPNKNLLTDALDTDHYLFVAGGYTELCVKDVVNTLLDKGKTKEVALIESLLYHSRYYDDEYKCYKPGMGIPPTLAVRRWLGDRDIRVV